MYLYILISQTGKAKANQLLKKILDETLSVPFIPMVEVFVKKAGDIKKELILMIPEYVFVESGLNSIAFEQVVNKANEVSNNIYNILRYGNTNEIQVREDEKGRLFSLFDEDYVVKSLSGDIIGGKILVKEGPLKGNENI